MIFFREAEKGSFRNCCSRIVGKSGTQILVSFVNVGQYKDGNEKARNALKGSAMTATTGITTSNDATFYKNRQDGGLQFDKITTGKLTTGSSTALTGARRWRRVKDSVSPRKERSFTR